MTSKFLELPSELSIHILSKLPAIDLFFSVQLTNRYLRTLISDSSLLQYQIALFFAGAEDNPDSSLVPVERKRALQCREKAWGEFAVGKKTTVSIKHQSSGLYDFTAGIYILGEHGGPDVEYPTTALRWLDMRQQELGVSSNDWTRICVDRNIVDFGMGVEEHDLIAIVTS